MAYLFSWRWAFRVTPPLAILFTMILFFFAEEPPRGATEVVPVSLNDEAEDDPVDGDKLSLRDFLTDLRLIWAVRSFAFSTFAFTAITFISGALSGWGPAFLQRVVCTDAADAGRCKSEINYKFGIIGSITGVAGTLIGAVLSQRYARATSNSDPVICCVGLLAAAPFIYLAVFLPPISTLYTWVSVFLAELFIGFTWAPTTAMLLYVTLPTQRSFAAGIQTLTSHLLGDALSPIFVGWLADNLYFNNDDLTRGRALQYALYPTSAFAVIGAIFFGISAKYVVGDRRMVEIQEHEQIGSAGALPEPSEAYFGQGSTPREWMEDPTLKDREASPRPALLP
uniref:Major facilitator superfamily (MFS) profile domain-containing protein n=1 Tax=Rhodosorus marinus TaxID=101924 RepID=A0A7S0FZ40_9RHOD|mmetsp:Transcript_12875/g.18525  ORF Transcript_12875/g.18525 Transcript_12875/m.18525 type:complete len:339 (+) Transcript_12875:1095-2111(+)